MLKNRSFRSLNPSMAKMESLICLIIFSLFSLSSSLPSEAVIHAAAILLDSGFISMALTLRLVSQTLIPQPPSATIFSPSDAAFAKFGQPPLSLLKFHFSPLAFSIESLRSLPYGTKIPTLFPGRSLIVTTSASNEQISLNNVTINGSPIYGDGTLIIFGIEKFFDPIFHVSAPIQSPSPNIGCILSMSNPTPSSSDSLFDKATELLRSNGYSVVASFLDLQLPGLFVPPEMTVFAPIDKVMLKHVGNFTEYSSLFLRHVLPCKLARADLVNFRDGTVFRTALEGFTINITRSGDALMLNEVQVIHPDIYNIDWLVIHGLREILLLPEKSEQGAESPSESRSNEEHNALDHSEF